MPANTELLWAEPTQEAVDLFTNTVKQALQPNRILFALLDAPENGAQPAEIAADHPLDGMVTRLLRDAVRPVLLGSADGEAGRGAEASADLKAAGWAIVVPLRIAERLIGWLLVGDKQAGEAYTRNDLDVLEAVCELGTTAMGHARRNTAAQLEAEAGKELISYVSHELKNPITAIKGYAEVLSAGKAGPLSERQAGFINTILDNAERMMVLVSDLNDVSRLEAGKLRLDLQPVSLYEAVDQAVGSMQGQIAGKEQELHLLVDEALPAVMADRTRLVQIVTNLLSNACKYTPDGGRIEVAAEKTAGDSDWPAGLQPLAIHLTVRDNGLGIRAEDQPMIFQKFFRSEDPEAHVVGGSGLGLSITRKLVELMGGLIWLESEHRKGTTFHVTLPAVLSE
jgi:signal transduction histidine kinase